MYLKKLWMTLMLCTVYAAVDGQTFRDRLFFGGNFGLMIGNYTDIELSPHVGYYLTNRWAVGIGFTYEYFNAKEYWLTLTGAERYETHIFGGRIFTTYVIINNISEWLPLGFPMRIFAHVEYEALSYENGFFTYDATGRRLLNNVLVGGGFRFPMGRRSSMNLSLLWNLNSSLYDIYGGGPIIRLGYNF